MADIEQIKLDDGITYNISDAKALKDFTISLGGTGASGVRKPKFLSIDYTGTDDNNAIIIKLSLVCCHANASSYRYLEDSIISVGYTGNVSINTYKYFDTSAGTVDGVSRKYGDIFYTKDTTNKVVDFYVLTGQYSTLKMTPYKRLNSATAGTITQFSGAPSFYSSGTVTYGKTGIIATIADIPTALSSLSEDSTHRLVTDDEKTSWNGKYDKSGGKLTGDILLTGTAASSVDTTTKILFTDASGSTEYSRISANTSKQLVFNDLFMANISEASCRPTSAKSSASKLGTSTYPWNDIYGTNIYQNGTKVSVTGHKHTKSDITDFPTIPSAVTESTVSGWGFTKNTGTYSKPSGGIPKTDLASAVQTSLGKADTALQSHQDISGKTDKSTLTTKGDIYYASAANTPARLGIGSSGQVLTVSNGVPAWATPSGGSATHLYKHTITFNSNTLFSDWDQNGELVIISTSNSTTNYTEVLNKAINKNSRGHLIMSFYNWNDTGEPLDYAITGYSSSSGELIGDAIFYTGRGYEVVPYTWDGTIYCTFDDVVTQIV